MTRSITVAYILIRGEIVSIVLTLLVLVWFSPFAFGSEKELTASLRELGANVLDDQRRQELGGMVAQDIERRRLRAIQRENAAWDQVKDLRDWERFRDARIDALRDSLGEFPDAPEDLDVRITGRLGGIGYRIENLVFQTRPGLFVTANL